MISSTTQLAGIEMLRSLASAQLRGRKSASTDTLIRQLGVLSAVPKGRSGITVVIPARDEGAALADALQSIARQTLGPDRIVIVVNNSTDNTKDIAQEFASINDSIPTCVLEMPGVNRHRKAGALNYGIRYLLRNGLFPPEVSYLLVMDGDTELESNFLKRARRVLERDDSLGGVSAACLGKPIRGETPWSSLLLLFQRIEYARFAFTRLRRNVHTMSGAGSFYRIAALNDLLRQRADVFEERESNLVEDYETTLALKVLGWRITSNQGCVAYTDLMPNLHMLLAQRVRWVRGTVDEWRRYGWRRHTCLSIIGMILAVPGVLYTALWVTVSVKAFTAHGMHPDYRYSLLAIFWSLYQGFSVRRMGFKIILFEMALLPEALFNLIRDYWVLKSIISAYLGNARSWK
jgi:cellulose synthase/poly-beta-1,6-N-acetylglucosamine synthase-like glycosyltransferase